MPTLDITDDQADRIEALREELAAAHAGPYASVDREDAVAYLLDLAAAVDDPDRLAEPTAGGDESRGDAADASDGPEADEPFDRERARELLSARNRRHTDPDPDDPMDLSDIASAFDVTGRSGMTKAELVDAIVDAAERLAADPFARVDIELDDETGDGTESAESETEPAETKSDEADPENASDDADDGEGDGEDDDDDGEDDAGDDGTGQLNAMMSLLDTHADKWREGDGDARYEVDLPDGSVETARTKDDVRALLFRNY
ncbi:MULTISPECIES: hypothetical protein [Halorubrum]|uniref:Rho termination factor N-terminal domain-containing protein n=1 Tax=Halorubrum hochstenium ATCC 700873 TaxID=1227481 RepID=M0F0G7_9EURY|nr:MULTISPECIES: hypothetical protein [Halorubrum]ELZ53435.1 hypothetical protein C467_13762 [Halorubrum hochstenium ATCC 700873]